MNNFTKVKNGAQYSDEDTEEIEVAEIQKSGASKKRQKVKDDKIMVDVSKSH